MAEIHQIIAHVNESDEVELRGYDLSHSYALVIGPFTLIASSLVEVERKLDAALHAVVTEKTRLAMRYGNDDRAYDRAVGL